MKKNILTLSFALAIISAKAQFSPNNIVVLRLGDSVSSLANTGNPIVLQQYTTAGNFVNMTYLPRTGSNAVTLSSTATSEGAITLSTDRTTINFIGYRVAPPHSSSLASTATSSVNRAIVSVNASGTTSIPTLTTSLFSANNPRGAISVGTGFFAVGANSGVAYGTTTTNLDTIVSNSSTNNRCVKVFSGQLFFSTGSGTRGIWRVGNGIPTNSGNVSVNYIPTGSSASSYDFDFNNDTNICYIADDRVASSGGGIQKWVRVGSTWSLAYTLSVGNNVGSRGLTVNWNTGAPTIFATTAESTRNRIVRIIDTGALSIPFTMDTAATNTIFRGIAYTPGSLPLPVTFGSFNAKKVNQHAISLHWNTITETNNSHFEVQRSFDGNDFETIGTVKGKGNSNSIVNYNYIDNNNQTAYYRLKQIDFDGNFNYSSVINVSFNELNIVVSPNPFQDNITIGNQQGETLKIEVTDLNGRLFAQAISAEPNVMLNTSNIKDGIYILKVSNGVQTEVKRIIKK